MDTDEYIFNEFDDAECYIKDDDDGDAESLEESDESEICEDDCRVCAEPDIGWVAKAFLLNFHGNLMACPSLSKPLNLIFFQIILCCHAWTLTPDAVPFVRKIILWFKDNTDHSSYHHFSSLENYKWTSHEACIWSMVLWKFTLIHIHSETNLGPKPALASQKDQLHYIYKKKFIDSLNEDLHSKEITASNVRDELFKCKDRITELEKERDTLFHLINHADLQEDM